MKNLFYLIAFFAVFAVGCSSDDDPQSPAMAFELNATGTVANQTPEEAKQTINGNWRVGQSAAKIASAGKANSCTFYAIEFTDDRYAMAFSVAGDEDPIFAYGTYTLNEAADGTVASVDLYMGVDGVNTKIAALTNIVVTESGNELTASFDVVFTLPDDIEDLCGDSLSGNYSADKEDVVDGAESADEDSNFALLVNTWRLSSYSDSEGGTLEEIYQAPCFDLYDDLFDEIMEEQFAPYFESRAGQLDNPSQEELDALAHQIRSELYEEVDQLAVTRAQQECDPATRIEISFSAYGTYLITYFTSDGTLLYVDRDSWDFNNAAQTELIIDGEDVGTINQLDATTLNITFSETYEGEVFTGTYGLTIVN